MEKSCQLTEQCLPSCLVSGVQKYTTEAPALLQPVVFQRQKGLGLLRMGMGCQNVQASLQEQLLTEVKPRVQFRERVVGEKTWALGGAHSGHKHLGSRFASLGQRWRRDRGDWGGR